MFWNKSHGCNDLIILDTFTIFLLVVMIEYRSANSGENSAEFRYRGFFVMESHWGDLSSGKMYWDSSKFLTVKFGHLGRNVMKYALLIVSKFPFDKIFLQPYLRFQKLSSTTLISIWWNLLLKLNRFLNLFQSFLEIRPFCKYQFSYFFVDEHARESKDLANYRVWQISFLLNLINAERPRSETALKKKVKLISIFTSS